MKVVQKTQLFLILKDNQMKKLLFGLIIFLFGLCFILLTYKISTIKIDKATGKLTYSRVGLLGRKSGEIHISEIYSVGVEEASGSKGGTTYRVVLQTKRGKFPLTNYFSSGYQSGYQSKKRIADKISHFLGILPSEMRRR
jgi:hypothetical protein